MGGMGWAPQCTENQRVCWVGTPMLGVLTVLGRFWVGTLMAEPPNIFRVCVLCGEPCPPGFWVGRASGRCARLGGVPGA